MTDADPGFRTDKRIASVSIEEKSEPLWTSKL